MHVAHQVEKEYAMVEVTRPHTSCHPHKKVMRFIREYRAAVEQFEAVKIVTEIFCYFNMRFGWLVCEYGIYILSFVISI